MLKHGVGSILSFVVMLGFLVGLGVGVAYFWVGHTEQDNEYSVMYVESVLDCEKVSLNVQSANPSGCGGSECCLKIRNTGYLGINKTFLRNLDSQISLECPGVEVGGESFCGSNILGETEIVPVVSTAEGLVGCSAKSGVVDCESDPCAWVSLCGDYSTPAECSADSCGVGVCEWSGGACIRRVLPQGCVTQGLVGYWKLDETSGLTASDSSGNGKDGVLVNNPSWLPGYVNGGLSLDNNNEYVDMGSTGSIDFSTNKITIASWVNIRGFSDTCGCYVTKGGYSGGYRMCIRSNHRVKLQLTGSHYTLYSSSSVNNNEWHHIVGRYDGSKMQVFIDGVKDSNEMSRSGDIGSTSSRLFLGWAEWSYPFNGIVDEVRIYNRSLSDSEIADLYNNCG